MTSLRAMKNARVGWPLLLLLIALPGHAQYKVVDSNGKVTYTDRLPAAKEAKVTPLTSRAAATGTTAGDAALPPELRQAVARYPVTLYVVGGACSPCEMARQLLRDRGIPYTEKSVLSAEDSEALERLSGGRDAPTLSIGSQTLRGLAPEVWGSYLDAAGYPRESHLPAGYPFAAATPLTERREAGPREARAASSPSTAVPAVGSQPTRPSGIQF